LAGTKQDYTLDS